MVNLQYWLVIQLLMLEHITDWWRGKLHCIEMSQLCTDTLQAAAPIILYNAEQPMCVCFVESCSWEHFIYCSHMNLSQRTNIKGYWRDAYKTGGVCACVLSCTDQKVVFTWCLINVISLGGLLFLKGLSVKSLLRQSTHWTAGHKFLNKEIVERGTMYLQT